MDKINTKEMGTEIRKAAAYVVSGLDSIIECRLEELINDYQSQVAWLGCYEGEMRLACSDFAKEISGDQASDMCYHNFDEILKDFEGENDDEVRTFIALLRKHADLAEKRLLERAQ